MRALVSLSIYSGDFLIVSAALSVLMAALAIWHSLVARDPMVGRLRALERRRSELKDNYSQARQNEARGDLRISSVSLMRRFFVRLQLMRGDRVELIALRLARAGWRSRDAIVMYLSSKAILPIVVGGVGLMLGGALSHASDAGVLRVLGFAAGAAAGVQLPDLWIKNAADKSGQASSTTLPDALDLLVLCAEAGLSLDAAMARVGREIATTSLELADEFSLTAIELGFLPSRQAALHNLMNRTDASKLRGLVNSLLQTERYGTPLAQALRAQAAEFRDERMLRAEEKAGKLPATMTIPMILFILPALFIVIGGPAVIEVIPLIAKL